MDIKSAYYDGIFGTIRMDYEGDRLYFLNVNAEKIGKNERCAFTDRVYAQICEYLEGKRRVFDIEYVLRGTQFQKKVWRELEKIPYGQTVTYGEIAERIGNNRASRAVGGACNKNPVWLIVPCHRVVGANGSLTGYACGLEIKNALLAIEKE